MALPDRLVQAGVELLEEDGLADLTLRAIARRTGVSHGAPRRYFPTHGALLAAIAATGLQDLAARLETTDGPPEEQLVAAARNYLEFAAERPGMFDLIFRHDLLAGAGGNLRATSLPLFQNFGDLVARIHPDDAGLRATALWTNIHGLATLRATNALELLGTTNLEPIVRYVVHSHMH
ncbi:TetR family transcriptional regulator [Kribbella sp. VKM Ac-2571]|uniref:TetR/AcrR family transcriptional regulator n=1 Tax=Kribbella sp. VKM Ac-2571 TaxID=2512222 RepID=UPI0010E1AB5E|nr:TetR/AcrR family transcriptional regulator [Kribbella sp. VKM Ac-2571]TDO59834.1 TetR family transcriptional regulator [Kribbella sp. VKM Ac-2571]